MKGSRIHLDLFKIFIDLAESGSFSRAAEQNLLTQSAVSQQVGFLERVTGKKLVERGKGGFALTENGKVYLAAARNILHAHQEALNRIRHPGELCGEVRVEAIYSIGLHPMAPYVGSFMRRHKKVDLRVAYSRANRIYVDLLAGHCDVGLVAYPERSPMLVVTPFRREEMGVVCCPREPLSRRRRLRVRDLAGRAFVAFDTDIPTRKAVDAFLRSRRVAVSVTHEFDNIEVLKRSVETGAGVSILPKNTVAEEVKAGTLAYLPFSDAALIRPTAILRRQDRSLSRAAREFIRWLSK